MDEFVKLSKNKKRLLEIIGSLELDEGLEIVRDRDGTEDAYFVKRTKKIAIPGKLIK